MAKNQKKKAQTIRRPRAEPPALEPEPEYDPVPPPIDPISPPKPSDDGTERRAHLARVVATLAAGG